MHFGYYDDWENAVLKCPKCGWEGTFKQGSVEYYDALMDSSCPRCSISDAPILAVVSYPTIKDSRDNWDKLSELERRSVEAKEHYLADVEARKLRDPSQLPGIESSSFILHWDFDDTWPRETLIKYGETIVFREPAIYEGYHRFIEVAKILKARYGSALCDLVPTKRSEEFLYGDRMSADYQVDQARKSIFRNATENT